MIKQSSSITNRKINVTSEPEMQNSSNMGLHRPIIINRRSVKSRRRHRKSNFLGDENGDITFLGIVLRVAIVLFLICAVVYVMLFRYFNNETSYHTIRSNYEKKGDLNFIAESGAKHTSTAAENIFESTREIDSEDFLPDEALGDCFDIAQSLPTFHDEYGNDIGDSNEMTNDQKNIATFIRRVKSIQAEFSARYGGENKARAMLARGLNSFKKETEDIFINQRDRRNNTGYLQILQEYGVPVNVINAANRIVNAHREKRPFKISFAGYSVTVGRGNYFHQSYPFVLERILKEPMKLLGVDLQVRNAAIGGTPSFPYGWCLDNFLGIDADVISWDYSMNESGGVSAGIEAYIRQALKMKHNPMLIVKDTHMAPERRDVVAHYVKTGYLRDAVIITSDPAVEPFLKEDETSRPPGFQKWREFGAPKGAPGQARHHPSVKEHELIGWMLAMHFLAAMEVAADMIMRNLDLKEGDSSEIHLSISKLPPPLNMPRDKSAASSMLFGVPNSSNEWIMNPVSCRTTFDPILNGTLKEIVTSGLAEELDLMLPKSEMIFKEGWVLDYGEGEKKAKRKLQPYDGLGYIDSKKAYYGLPMSNSLNIWLPWEGFEGKSRTIESPEDNLAEKWFRSLLLCEVNEERGDGECRLDKNLKVIVGGEEALNISYIDAVGVSYLAKTICVEVSIPSLAKVSKKDTDDKVGLEVKIKVTGEVQLRKGPCSISHVIWEETSTQ